MADTSFLRPDELPPAALVLATKGAKQRLHIHGAAVERRDLLHRCRLQICGKRVRGRRRLRTGRRCARAATCRRIDAYGLGFGSRSTGRCRSWVRAGVGFVSARIRRKLQLPCCRKAEGTGGQPSVAECSRHRPDHGVGIDVSDRSAYRDERCARMTPSSRSRRPASGDEGDDDGAHR